MKLTSIKLLKQYALNQLQPNKAQLASAVKKISQEEIVELIQLIDSRNLYGNVDNRYIDKLIYSIDKANIANFLYTIEHIRINYHDHLLTTIYKSYNDVYDFVFNHNYVTEGEKHNAFNIILNNQYNINRVLGKIKELDLFEKEALYNKINSMNDEYSMNLLKTYLSEAEIEKFKKE